MNIISGVIQKAKKVVIYGPEGIGKSTFASQFPKPLFSDTEGSTNGMNVSRFEKASSWSMFLAQIDYVKHNPAICNTYVIDTVDWAEMLCIKHICDTYQKKGIEDFGYGNGYVYVKEEFARFLDKLTELIDSGVNVVLTAHAQIRKFEQPDEMGSYDRYELKLGKKTQSQTSPLIKEWADMVLFANYKTYSVATDDKGKKFKAQGGSRVMYTTHHPCWDAKNRYGLPDEMPFSYDGIRHIIEVDSGTAAPAEQVKEPEPVIENTASQVQEQKAEAQNNTIPGVPKALSDLMIANNVTEKDIQTVVSMKGYFPANMPIENYPADFINGVLIGAWKQVYNMIEEINTLPFGAQTNL